MKYQLPKIQRRQQNQQAMKENQLQIKKGLAYAVKSAQAQIQDVDMTKRIVTGFYNSYNFFDDGNDVLLMGCAAKSISDRGPAGPAVQKDKASQ